MSIDYDNRDEHTHSQKVPFLVWALLAATILLSLSQAALAVYLTKRAHLADQRNTRTAQQATALRRSVCEVLDPIKAGQVRGVDEARALPFPVGGHTSPLCPPLTHKQQAHPTVSPAPGQTVIPGPTTVRTVTPKPAPTVIVTRTATPRPTSRPPTRTPSPTPRPSPTCDLNHLIRCLP